jgi:hypothetical protein
MNKLAFTFLKISFALFLFSCNGSVKEKEIEKEVTKEEKNVFDSDEFDFVLPQPISLAKAFQASGLAYYPNLTNPVKNKLGYNEKVKQLLNLGIYSTDLAYCAINEHPNEAREYLKIIQELGVSVGLKPVFADKKMIDNFDKNLNNMEAVEDLIYDIQERSEEYMHDNDVRYLSIVQFSGAWIEGMYLGVKDIELKEGNSDKMSITIVDQMNILKNIIKGLTTYPTSDKTLSKVSNKLTNILDTYSNFESVKKSSSKDSFQTPVLTSNEFISLSTKISALRNFIIN